MCWGYMGGSVLAVGGGAPCRPSRLRPNRIRLRRTVIRPPCTVDRILTGPIEPGPGPMPIGWPEPGPLGLDRRPSGCSRRYGSARHGTVSTGPERQDAARTRQDAPGSTRTGRGYARSTGRQDATGGKLRARARCVQILHTFLRSVRPRKSPGSHCSPGASFVSSRLGSD